MAVAAALLALAFLYALLRDPGGASGASFGEDAALQRAAVANAQAKRMARLQAQVDDLQLRVRILEQNSSYTTTTGVHLPPVANPLAAQAPPDDGVRSALP